jgi:hypothetical protein
MVKMSIKDPYRMRKRPLEKETDLARVEEGLRDVLRSTEQSKIETRKTRARKSLDH